MFYRSNLTVSTAFITAIAHLSTQTVMGGGGGVCVGFFQLTFKILLCFFSILVA